MLPQEWEKAEEEDETQCSLTFFTFPCSYVNNLTPFSAPGSHSVIIFYLSISTIGFNNEIKHPRTQSNSK